MGAFLRENSLWLLLAMGTAYSCVRLWRHREKLRLSGWLAVVLGVLHTLVGLLSVKVFAVLETLDFSKIENMSLFGGVFFMPLLYYAGGKLLGRELPAVYDVFTPCMVFTVMCARVNCIVTGCCLGLPIGSSSLRYPTRELELVFYIGIMIYFLYCDRKKPTQGLYYPLYMGLYGLVRFVLECFRVSDVTQSIWHISHIWAVVAFLLGLTFYVELKSRTPVAPRKKKGK